MAKRKRKIDLSREFYERHEWIRETSLNGSSCTGSFASSAPKSESATSPPAAA
jgi:hypothetical protein